MQQALLALAGMHRSRDHAIRLPFSRSNRALVVPEVAAAPRARRRYRHGRTETGAGLEAMSARSTRSHVRSRARCVESIADATHRLYAIGRLAEFFT